MKKIKSDSITIHLWIVDLTHAVATVSLEVIEDEILSDIQAFKSEIHQKLRDYLDSVHYIIELRHCSKE